MMAQMIIPIICRHRDGRRGTPVRYHVSLTDSTEEIMVRRSRELEICTNSESDSESRPTVTFFPSRPWLDSTGNLHCQPEAECRARGREIGPGSPFFESCFVGFHPEKVTRVGTVARA